MKQKCIEAVARAIGREITKVEAEAIERRLGKALQAVARKDPQAWQAMPQAERFTRAAQLAGEDLVHEAGTRKLRAALQIRAQDASLATMAESMQAGKGAFQAVEHQLDRVDILRKGVERQYFARLMDTLEASAPRLLGAIENPKAMRDLVFEIWGRDTGSAAAKAGAKAWRETVEAMRGRFNRSGGDIGRLGYGYIPQPHDTARIRAATADAYATRVLPLLDRSRYLDDMGRPLPDSDMLEVLRGVRDTLASEGVNKLDEGAYRGEAMTAKHFSQHRELHFSGPEAYLSYMSEYGRGTVFLSMQHHVGRLARDIALVESMGPNANATFRLLWDTALKTGASDRVGPFLVSTKDMFATLTGHTAGTYDGGPFYQRLADVAQGVRNVETFGKLQGAMLSSVTDLPTYFLTTHFNRLPVWQAALNLVRASGKESRQWANRAGLIAESVISDMNRWGENNIGQGWSGRVANLTMKASLLTGWTDALRRAFSVTMMQGLGRLSRLEWGALDPSDHARLAAKGVTEADFRIWKLAQPEDWRGEAMLTPEALGRVSLSQIEAAGIAPLSESSTAALKARDLAISRLLGVITDEAEYASVGPDLHTRAAIERGTQKGTITGELLRSVALFKSFPFAMISRHWRRAFDQPTAGGRLAYGASLMTGLTVFGALALQLKDMANGKDPRDMSTPKFWGAAFAQGGGAGIFGDFLYTGMGGQNRAGLPNWTTLAGPVLGSGLELVDLTAGNIAEAARGEDTHAGAEALRFARSHAPLVNLWYARGAIDRAVLHDLQEQLSPGYLARMEARAQRDWNQHYWWRPGEIEPDRAPEFSGAVGE